MFRITATPTQIPISSTSLVIMLENSQIQPYLLTVCLLCDIITEMSVFFSRFFLLLLLFLQNCVAMNSIRALKNYIQWLTPLPMPK